MKKGSVAPFFLVKIILAKQEYLYYSVVLSAESSNSSSFLNVIFIIGDEPFIQRFVIFSIFAILFCWVDDINTGVTVDFALFCIKFKFESISVAPVFTVSPSSTALKKPSPFNSTVSIPTFIKIIKSSGIVLTTMAGFVANISKIVQLQGATTLSPDGFIAIPSPTIFSEKTTSGTSSRGTIVPVIGAYNIKSAFVSSWLDNVELNHPIKTP